MLSTSSQGRAYPSHTTLLFPKCRLSQVKTRHSLMCHALTRLQSVFVTLIKDIQPVYTGVAASQREGNMTADRRQWNDFFSPAHWDNKDGTLTLTPIREFEAQLQLGSKLFPEYPIRSHNEAFYQLKKTLGVQASSVHNFSINPIQYRDFKFIWATDCEKVLDAGFTGINTRAGDLMSVSLKYKNGGVNDARHLADRVHIVLHSDQIMEIRDSGVQVFD